MTPDAGRLHVDADLSLEVDGAPVRVESSGARVRVVADDVRGLVDQLRTAARAAGAGSPRDGVATLADRLAADGLTGVLAAPTGDVAVIGAGVDSPVGGLLWGTRRVHVDTLGLVRSSDAARWTLAGAAALLLVVLAARRRRR
ncbi:hypothetical protein SAMN06893096_11098 [Geodermatophilus pulveris]|uniref:Uncharacterized protein n=1 Tax=Geodermatophilus pulveris TaxID=1564159 RepID=A0A239IBE6_9ACTN|nr:hypothetical protein [Geodermatophilus pulveris]SNS91106.1 hypothetical protein SAMN06893096_11098 [Geodermatophilus pulveris]